MNDTERLDWLQKHEGCNLISDDFGRWAVSTGGFQNLPGPDELNRPFDAQIVSWVEKEQWKNSVREAIDFAMEERD